MTVQLVRKSLWGMLAALPGTESTPPLYYLLAWPWSRAFGTGSPKFERAAVRWLARLGEGRETSLRDIRLAANPLEALRTKHHDLAEKMLLRFLG